MKDLKIILVSFFMMTSLYVNRAYAQEPTHNSVNLDFTDKSRLFMLGGQIKDTAKLVNKMLKVNSGNLNLVIDSPGGRVTGMLKLDSAIAILKNRGVTVNCLVTGMAASAAFWTWNECSNRYTLKMSLLMFHEGGMNTPIGKLIPVELTYLNDYQRKHQLEKMGMDPVVYEKAYKASYTWTPSELLSEVNSGYFKVITDVKLPKGVDLFYLVPKRSNLFKKSKSPRRGKPKIPKGVTYETR